jgi:hypothetical protein
MELRTIYTISDQYQNDLFFKFSNGSSHQSLLYAVSGGINLGITSTQAWDVPQDEYISQIEVRSGDFIDAVTFITNKGNRSPKSGGDGGSPHVITIPDDYRFVGYYGKQAHWAYPHGYMLLKLGFILGKVIQPTPTKELGKMLLIL